MAALDGDDARVAQLLAAGANVNHADGNGWTALICAAAGEVAIVQQLLASGAKAAHAAKDGMTARKRAESSGHAAIVALL